MSLLRGLTLLPLPSIDKNRSRHYVPSFAYEFGDEANSLFSIGPLSGLQGFNYTLDFSVIKQSAVLSSMKSMMFSATYATGVVVDGSYIIYVPDTGQITRFGSPLVDVGGDIPGSVLSGCIPLVTNAPPTTIQIAKESNSSTHAMFGTFTATFYDFELPAWVNQGYYGKTS